MITVIRGIDGNLEGNVVLMQIKIIKGRYVDGEFKRKHNFSCL